MSRKEICLSLKSAKYPLQELRCYWNKQKQRPEVDYCFCYNPRRQRGWTHWFESNSYIVVSQFIKQITLNQATGLTTWEN